MVLGYKKSIRGVWKLINYSLKTFNKISFKTKWDFIKKY